MDKLQELIQKKLAKGKTIPEIADALEEEEDTIRWMMEEMKMDQKENLTE